jgi:tetratricopeptide (TPR) repeat protein
MNDEARQDEVRQLLERGLYYLGCGLTEDAARHLAEAAALAPDDPAVCDALARLPASSGSSPRRPGRVHEIQPAKSRIAAMPAAPTAAPMHSGGGRFARTFAEAFAAGDWDAAARAAETLTGLQPTDAKAWTSLALAEQRRGRFDAALAAHDRAIELTGDDPEFLRARAKTLWEAGRLDAAEAAYGDLLERLDEDGPGYADARMSRGMIRMTAGDFADGLEDYEWRWRTGKIALPDVPQPYWSGALARDDRILLYGEQGFGDAIQFARYVPWIAERCASVVMPCKPPLRRLMTSLKGAPDVRDQTISRGDFDQFVPAMSCFRVFGADRRAIPAEVPYLSADPADVEKFRAAIGDGAPAVGIAWTGSPTNAISWKKTIPPERWAPLIGIGDARFFSLQVMRDDMTDDVKTVPKGVTDLAPDIADFADTAAAIECLDLVITVDTAVAHLAGALGKPVWTLLPFSADWRWGNEGARTPWYPTMTLYRQQTPGDWDEVMARVAADLAGHGGPGEDDAAGAATPAAKKRRGLTRLLPWRR